MADACRERPSPSSPLLSLARELRDNIYSHCTRDLEPKLERVTKHRSGGRRKLTIHDGPHLALLLVSRQISKEYGATIHKKVTLVVQDTLYARITQVPELTAPFQHLTRLDSSWFLWCNRCHKGRCNSSGCGVYIEAAYHIECIKQLTAQMAQLKTCHVKLDVWWPTVSTGFLSSYPQSPHGFELSQTLENFAGIQAVTSIEVNRNSKDYTTTPYATWSKESGWTAAEEPRPRTSRRSAPPGT